MYLYAHRNVIIPSGFENRAVVAVLVPCGSTTLGLWCAMDAAFWILEPGVNVPTTFEFRKKPAALTRQRTGSGKFESKVSCGERGNRTDRFCNAALPIQVPWSILVPCTLYPYTVLARTQEVCSQYLQERDHQPTIRR